MGFGFGRRVTRGRRSLLLKADRGRGAGCLGAETTVVGFSGRSGFGRDGRNQRTRRFVVSGA
ncbi:MAG: hypothetical protein CMJ52_03920 [Planctomycetaceae bacterium]|nr:hypothetical protein [Planctomycetaceae bacterium]